MNMYNHSHIVQDKRNPTPTTQDKRTQQNALLQRPIYDLRGRTLTPYVWTSLYPRYVIDLDVALAY